MTAGLLPRYIMPGDYSRAISLDLSRAEVITLFNALIEDIKAYEEKGASYLNLNRLAEKLDQNLLTMTHNKPNGSIEFATERYLRDKLLKIQEEFIDIEPGMKPEYVLYKIGRIEAKLEELLEQMEEMDEFTASLVTNLLYEITETTIDLKPEVIAYRIGRIEAIIEKEIEFANGLIDAPEAKPL